MPNDPSGENKENICQNMQGNPNDWSQALITDQDKEFIKANIFQSLDVATKELKNKMIS
jgi:hypothetical protein